MNKLIEGAETPSQLIHALSLTEVYQEAHDLFWKNEEEARQEKVRQDFQKLYY